MPQGKITLLEGDPGMGKSLLAIDIAAHVSTGLPIPGDSTIKKGSVVLIAPEDSAADTIKPRVVIYRRYISLTPLKALISMM